jgi:hypothetical protein
MRTCGCGYEAVENIFNYSFFLQLAGIVTPTKFLACDGRRSGEKSRTPSMLTDGSPLSVDAHFKPSDTGKLPVRSNNSHIFFDVIDRVRLQSRSAKITLLVED